jgi:DNA primase
LLYGLHRARSAAAQADCLVVVEGYTDVLMAHQMGILHVVATMGTALNARHVQKLRRFAPRVVLVFDADAGGQTGADRALGLFASQESDLAIATLPAGLDPCDLLVKQGPDAFREALGGAVDALDYKLTQVLGGAASRGIEEQRRAVDVILGIIALAPELPGQAGAVKSQLMVTRIAHRLSLKEETVWSRLKELRQKRNQREQNQTTSDEPRQAPAAPHERELIELLLADATMVPRVQPIIRPEMITHPGLRLLLEGLYALQDAGEPANLDQLRPRLENARLAAKALELQDVGRRHPDREGWLEKLLACFREHSRRGELQTLQQKLQAAQAAGDHETAVMLLRLIQGQKGPPPE